jgi:hypothetical protein
MAEGLSAKGIFNGDWNKLTGKGTSTDPLLYNGKRFSGTVKWANGSVNYANGVMVKSTTSTIKVDEGAAPESVPNQPVITEEDEPAAGDTGNRLTPEQAAAAGKAFGFMKQFLDKYPNDANLQKAWALLLDNDIAGAELAFKDSDYYINTLPESDKRIKKKLSQFGVYTQELNRFIDEQIKRLIQAGITLDPNSAAVKDMLEIAYDNAETDSQIDIKALALNSGKAIGGATGASIADLRSYAKAFGLKYSDADYNRWSEEVFSGKITAYDIQTKIRQDSASAFPMYSDKILSGESVDSIGSAYKASMSNILEIDPDSADWSDPLLRKALQYTEDGKPAVMPVWMFEQELRKDARWQYTDNARESVYNAIYQIGTDFGVL